MTDRIQSRAVILALMLTSVISEVTAETRRSLRGTVHDITGAVAVAADVTVSCGTDARSTRSDVDGRFEFYGLPARRCTLMAAGPRFAVHRAVDLTTEDTLSVRIELELPTFGTRIVITPSRGAAEYPFDVPESVSLVDRRDIESRPHQIVPQLLKEEPGVLVQQTTAAQGSPFLRGLTGQQVVQLVDGVRLNTSVLRSGPSQYLGWIDSAFVDRLEVVRGPASVQYGSDALGGSFTCSVSRWLFRRVGREAAAPRPGSSIRRGVSAQRRRCSFRRRMRSSGSAGRRVTSLTSGQVWAATRTRP